MCAYATPQASLSPIPSSGRSLFSRLTSPLRSRTRNLADFHIKAHEPHRRYSPGDTVKGIVVLTVVKPIRITHLTVALHGFVRVFKNPNGATETAPVEVGLTASTSKAHYFGNGHASLFQDEVILCGEGRLEVGIYEFEFNLEFPGKGLPSSIDFERGTISYMIRSTITRPTSIAATTTCDRKISLVETVDIGPMLVPKPRIISLEPIARRSKKPAKVKPKSDQEPTESEYVLDAVRSTESPVVEESVSQRASADHQPSTPRSPLNSDHQSEGSGESVVSSSTGMSFRLTPAPSTSKSGRDSQTSTSHDSIANKTITAKIELLKAGCLPGDSIPLKISIQHTKRITSPHGIIITLYRQGRIDSAPSLSLFTDLKGKSAEKLKHEEYYPKSKTGLGGLSLTSAGSSSVFRKDLAQTFAPIIIDPATLSTAVTVSVRVPDDVFPSITGVPGQMIDFRYHIEVVIDLGGKLAGQERHLPRLGMMSLPFITNNSASMMSRDVSPGNTLAAWGGNIVNTDQVRREKSVVACLFEIIVGTTDSARARGRLNTQGKEDGMESPRSQTFSNSLGQEYDNPQERTTGEETQESSSASHHDQHGQERQYPPQENAPDYHPELRDNNHQMEDSPYYTHVPVPIPEPTNEQGFSEKELVRRAEERWLPSQPPQEDGPSSAHAIEPSAPGDIDDTGFLPSASFAGNVDTLATIPEDLNRHTRTDGAPSAPDFGDILPHAGAPSTDDKQEIERRRLMAEASSPSDFPDEEENDGEGGSAAHYTPTAPVLTEADEYGTAYSNRNFSGQSRAHESLPRYEG